MERSTLEQHVEAGLTEREIAVAEECGQTTIRYWLRKHGLTTKWKRGGWGRSGGRGRAKINGASMKLCRALSDWDWGAIQASYDKGATWKRLVTEFGISRAALNQGRQSGLFKSRPIGVASKLSHEQGRDYTVYRTPEFRRRAARNGGYKPGSGTGKGAWVTNTVGQPVYLQSSYETRMATLLNEAHILWERPEGLPYQLDGKHHRYYADFLLPDLGIYLDTKNDYLIVRDGPKIEAVRAQCGIVLHVVPRESINAAFVVTLA